MSEWGGGAGVGAGVGVGVDPPRGGWVVSRGGGGSSFTVPPSRSESMSGGIGWLLKEGLDFCSERGEGPLSRKLRGGAGHCAQRIYLNGQDGGAPLPMGTIEREEGEFAHLKSIGLEPATLTLVTRHLSWTEPATFSRTK